MKRIETTTNTFFLLFIGHKNKYWKGHKKNRLLVGPIFWCVLVIRLPFLNRLIFCFGVPNYRLYKTKNVDFTQMYLTCNIFNDMR